MHLLAHNFCFHFLYMFSYSCLCEKHLSLHWNLELSLNTASFAKSAAMLGSAEDNTALSRALSQLAEVEDKMEQLHQEQAANDTFTFAEMIADYIRLLGAVRVRREFV